MRDAYNPAPNVKRGHAPYSRFGFCQECGKKFLIRNCDGQIRTHLADKGYGRVCEGSGKAPSKMLADAEALANNKKWAPKRRTN